MIKIINYGIKRFGIKILKIYVYNIVGYWESWDLEWDGFVFIREEF